MDITLWDKIPEEQQLYLSRNGRHFNKKLCEFAVSLMRKEGPSGNKVRVIPLEREEVEKMLAENGISMSDFDAPYDAVYVANMAKNDFLGSSLEDEQHVAKYVKDVLDDADGYDGLVLNRWLADMAGKGKWIDWERMV